MTLAALLLGWLLGLSTARARDSVRVARRRRSLPSRLTAPAPAPRKLVDSAEQLAAARRSLLH